MSATAILWLRRDLRLADNPALNAALEGADRLLPVYIHAPDEEAPWQPGGASRWWLHHSLAALDQELRARGSALVIACGETLPTLRRLIRVSGGGQVHWNRLYDPALVARDTDIKQALRTEGVRCESHNAALLFEPWQVKNTADQPYKVFSAYWRRCQPRLDEVQDPPRAPDRLPPLPEGIDTVALEDLGLLPKVPWDEGLRTAWQPGETGARQRLDAFLSGPIHDYDSARDIPAQKGTSRLSPHLHWGEIGPRQVLAAIRTSGRETDGSEAFVRELGWREFSHQLLYHFPHTPTEPLDRRFADFPWRDEDVDALLQAWQRGRTGIPIVDAGMRELWHTGWMHNRVRMIVASLLTKNLRLHWLEGARWFWDTLVDADLANNTQGWQWTAGSGADAAPYFRIFNPVRQGERFDPDGAYVRRWCPELAGLPNKLLHQPWEASASQLTEAGIDGGRDAVTPIIDLKESREEALDAYAQIKADSAD